MEGKTLSHFRVHSRIGHGGMGVVYKGEDLKLGRTVAIKVLPAELVRDSTRRARFVTEARTAAAVTHPNIATIYEIDESDGTTFIAMEYLEGDTLRVRMVQQPLPLKQAVQLGVGIAEGLAAAHGAKILHRDLKPDNVMVTRDGHAKILDFGLARLIESTPRPADLATDFTDAQTQSVTDPNQVLGTPAYMSPEQARGLELDYRSDIFAFGCTFYEMVTGQRAFRGATSTDTLSQVLTKDPVPATNINPDLPSSVQWILDKCLDKEAAERYQDTRDLVVDLHHLQRECQSLGTSARTTTMPQAPRAEAPTPEPTSQRDESAGFSVRSPASTTPASVTPAPIETGSGEMSNVSTQSAKVPARYRYAGVIVAAMVTIAVGLGLSQWFNRDQASEQVAEANSLAIFSFENLTDSTDPQRYGQIFQDVLITALSGLEPLRVYSGQRLFDIQKQLSTADDGRFDKEFATAVARRAGAEHMLTGSLGQLGNKWILTCQMQQVADGTVVFSKRIDGEDLYEVADVLTGELKNDLSVVETAEASRRVSVRDQTSSSLDAYRKYLDGVDLLNTNKYQEAAAAFREAIAIDPDFGQAYYRLATAVSWPGDDPDAAKEIYDEFLSRGLYASDKEKRLAQAARDRLDNQYAAVLREMEALVRDYPDEKDVWMELGETLFHFPGGGKEEEAREAFEKAAELDPDFLLPYQHIFDGLWSENRFEEAAARAQALIERDPANPFWYRYKAATLVYTVDENQIDAIVNEALPYQKTPADRRDLYAEVAGNIALKAPAKREEYYKKALAADPDHDHPLIVGRLMDQLRSRARWDEYEKWVRNEVEKNPDNTVFQNALRNVLVQTRRYDETLEYTKELARRDPDNPLWARRWSATAILNGDPEEIKTAIAAGERTAQSADDRRTLYSTLAGAYRGRGDQNQGLEYLRKALDAVPDQPYPFLYNDIGWCQLSRGRFVEAKRAFDRAIELNPNSTGALFGLLELAARKDDTDAVDSAARRLLETLGPGPFQVLGPAGQHLRAGRLEEARLLYEEYVGRPGPDWVALDSFTRVGNVYLDAGYVEQATGMFERATRLEVSQRRPDALNDVGLCQLVAGDYADAERSLQLALGVEYPNRRTRSLLAAAQILRGKRDAAEKTLEEELALRPHKSIDELLVLVYAEQGRYERALRLAEQCVTMDSSRVSHELLAWALISSEVDVNRGIREAERAMELPIAATDQFHQLPCFPPAEHSLGLAALKRGNSDAALAHLRGAAERMPSRESLQADLRRAETMVYGRP